MKAGELFAGYGGLAMAVTEIFGCTTAWVAEFDDAPSRILAQRFPGVPNLGDVTAVDWSTVEPVDVLAGGSPCQDVSAAGKRAGMSEGTRSNLWVAMREAIRTLEPEWVIWENVEGSLSARADSEMEQREGRVGDGSDGPVLRALGRVLGDLACLGFDAEWRTVAAADVGACHRRRRVFVLAHRRDAPNPGRLPGQEGGSQHPDTKRAGGHQVTLADVAEHRLLPSPVAQPSGNTPEDHLRKKPGRTTVTDLSIIVENGLLATGGRLLPSPRASDGPNGGPNMRGSKGDLPLPSAVMELLPTPKAADGVFDLPRTSGRPPEKSTHLATRIHYTDFGEYAPAIARHEAVFGRVAPSPTEPNRRGDPRLSPRFVEWMMMLPEGWVTGVGLSRSDELKALGNGVVPGQAAYALRHMLAAFTQQAEVAA